STVHGDDEVRAALLGPGVRCPEQRGADLVVAVHGGGDEVVPGGPVDVDDDAAVAERLADQASDAIEGGLELTRGADPARSGERVAQTREGRMGRSRHLVYSSAAGRLVLTLTCACSTAPGSGAPSRTWPSSISERRISSTWRAPASPPTARPHKAGRPTSTARAPSASAT